jgi:hypothetical protein
LFGVVTVRCDGGGAELVLVCVSNCPVDVDSFVGPPDVGVVRREIEVVAPVPRPVFGPPVQDGVAAVVGKYLYFGVDRSGFVPVGRSLGFAGGWFAEAVLTPLRVGLVLSGHQERWCEGPGVDGRSVAGRVAGDRLGCRVLVESVPVGAVARVLIRWRADVVSNIDGVAGSSWEFDTVAERAVVVRELQAVISN